MARAAGAGNPEAEGRDRLLTWLGRSLWKGPWPPV